MTRAWGIIKEVLLMQLHSLTRGTNYIVEQFTFLIQFSLLSIYFQSGHFTLQQQIQMIVESIIIARIWLIFFFFAYSPIREYIQRNWKEVNKKYLQLILKIRLWK